MNSQEFYNRVNRLKDELIRFRNAVCAYETTDIIRYPENFSRLGMEMVMKAEAIACSTRNIVSTFPLTEKNHVLQTAVDTQGIAVNKKKYGYEIILPGLIAKRSYRYNTEFLLEPLSYAIESFCKNNPITRLEKATIWYIYEYEEDMPSRNVRDYDNLEAKEVLDVINTFFLTDDGGEFCELHYSTKRSLSNCTRIIIMPYIGLFSYPVDIS